MFEGMFSLACNSSAKLNSIQNVFRFLSINISISYLSCRGFLNEKISRSKYSFNMMTKSVSVNRCYHSPMRRMMKNMKKHAKHVYTSGLSLVSAANPTAMKNSSDPHPPIQSRLLFILRTDLMFDMRSYTESRFETPWKT
jgi:hypothetical protein